MTSIPPPPPQFDDQGRPYGSPQPYGGPPPGGALPPQPGMPKPPRPGSGIATASMVIGIVTLVTCVGGVVLGPLAVILGLVAARKGGFEGKSITGIITGSVGFLIGATFAFIMVVGFLAAADEDPTLDRPIEELIDIPDDVVASDASSPSFATEEGVAASPYDTAYEAYAAEMNPSGVWDGIYEGAAVDTPCFTFDGAPWWVLQGEPEICDAAHELWWETSSSDPYTIKLFGSGGVGAAITVESIADATLERWEATDLESLTTAIADDFLPTQGVEVVSTSQLTLGGQPAYVIECVAPGLEHYNYYVTQAPRAYDAAGGSQYFAAHVYNEREWVNAWDDVTSRFEDTFTWK